VDRAEQIAQRLREVAERRAALSPEQLAKLERLEQGIPERLRCTFISPPTAKGRGIFYFATAEEADEYYATRP
jgi:hypothetical protein